MSGAEPAAQPHNIPLDVEDRIALEHLGRTMTCAPRFFHMTVSTEQISRALDDAYQAGWRAGVATLGGARAKP
jgi:hypothetical protein